MAVSMSRMPGLTAREPCRQSKILRLTLMRGFDLTIDGSRVRLPHSAQRLIAFLALNDRPVRRCHAAQTLYMDSSDTRSFGNLRTALWRLRRPDHELVEAAGECLSIGRAVVVDVHQLAATARKLLRGSDLLDIELAELVVGGDLLPGWYEEWVVMERERTKQLWLQTLETASARLHLSGRHSDAVAAGLAAVESEPLRESAHRAVIVAHLAAGNRADALRQYRRYASVLESELRLEPSADMRAIVGVVE
jgi:DNA-binding SARP family transcriptional activator